LGLKDGIDLVADFESVDGLDFWNGVDPMDSWNGADEWESVSVIYPANARMVPWNHSTEVT